MISWAALLAGVTVMAFAHVVVPPRRALASRVRPYAALARSRLGTGYADASVVLLTDPDERSVLRRVLGPIATRTAEGLGRVVDAADADTLAVRLRHAGLGDITPDQYRMRQLGTAVAGVALGAAAGVTVVGSAAGVLLLMACFGFPAATLQRNRVERAITERRERMRTEAYTVAQLVAVHVRSGHGPVDAVRSVCALGRGPLVAELREILSWISGGTSPQRAYDKAAERTAEPAAARLFRLLAASSRSGGDIAGPLLAIADDIRSERREDLARRAVARRTAMVVPLLVCIAPVMVLFVGAALPSLVMGR